MLGALIQPRDFSWAAFGKHPVATDYIRLAAGTGLMEAVGEWMSKGYDQFIRRSPGVREPHSFRFWLRGARKGTLLCGLGRDSSDRIGRPFPFFIMGEGGLKGWEPAWENLPQQLEPAWRRMEAIASGRYDDIPALAASLNQLSVATDARRPRDAAPPEHAGLPAAYHEELNCTGGTLIDLGTLQDDPERAVDRCLIVIKAWLHDVPTAVFIGGPPRRTWLAVMERALNTEDFIRLWST